MVLSLSRLPLQESEHHWQELRLLRSSNMPLSQRTCSAQWAGRAGTQVGYEQSGTQWE